MCQAWLLDSRSVECGKYTDVPEGSLRRRMPVASWIAFATAAMSGLQAVSPPHMEEGRAGSDSDHHSTTQHQSLRDSRHAEGSDERPSPRSERTGFSCVEAAGPSNSPAEASLSPRLITAFVVLAEGRTSANLPSPVTTFPNKNLWRCDLWILSHRRPHRQGHNGDGNEPQSQTNREEIPPVIFVEHRVLQPSGGCSIQTVGFIKYAEPPGDCGRRASDIGFTAGRVQGNDDRNSETDRSS
jgi:hypothetical protein